MQLHTERLIIRDYCPEDLAAFLQLETSPETHFYDRWQPGEADLHAYLEQAQRWTCQSPRIHYRLAVQRKLDSLFIGRITIVPGDRLIRECEIGWAFLPDYWGQGYATEAARALLTFAFNELGCHRAVAVCHVGNLASLGVMEKLGMRREAHLRETLPWQGGWSDEYVYSILEREWQINSSPTP